MASPFVVIIVVNWNGQADTLACLASLAHIDYPAAHVVVVDNGSSDDSVAAIRSAFPAVKVLETSRNLGYVGGNNAGLAYARQQQADYALLLNNDTEVAPDFLTRLVEGAEATGVGAASPAIYYHDLPESFWSMGGTIDWQRGDTTMLGEGQKDTGQFGEQPFVVDFVTGCALLIKMAVVDRIGPLDARFFAYYEDAEWCVRVERAGYEVAIIPGSKIWHKITPKARFASNVLAYYVTRNRLLFLKLTGAGLRAWIYALVLDIGRTVVSYSLRPRWRYKRLARRAMLCGLLDFYRGRFGPMPAGVIPEEV